MHTEKHNHLLRILLGVFLLLSLFSFHFIVTLSIGIIGLLFIPYFWEFLVASVFMELLYRGGEVHSWFMLLFPIFTLCLFFVVELSRTYIREEVLRS